MLYIVIRLSPEPQCPCAFPERDRRNGDIEASEEKADDPESVAGLSKENKIVLNAHISAAVVQDVLSSISTFGVPVNTPSFSYLELAEYVYPKTPSWSSLNRMLLSPICRIWSSSTSLAGLQLVNGLVKEL